MKTFLLPCAYVGLLFGGLSFWINADIYRGALLSPTSFRQTLGQISLSQIDGFQRRKRGIRLPLSLEYEKAYSADIRFRYQVGGKNLESRRVHFDLPLSLSDPGAARAQVSKYPVGKRVQVFYRAGDPTFAVLEPQNKGRTLRVFWITSGLWLSALGFVLCTLARRILGREK